MVSMPVTDLERLTRFACFGIHDGVYNVQKKNEFSKETTPFIDSILDSPLTIKEAVERLKKIFEQKCFIGKAALLYALARITQNAPKSEPQTELTQTRHSAYMLARDVCETAEDLFTFLDFDKKLTASNKLSTGRGIKKLIRNFYESRTATDLVLEATRCKSARNWNHKSVLKMAHINPKRKGKDTEAVLEYLMCGRRVLDQLKENDDPKVQVVVGIIKGVESLKATCVAEKEVVRSLIEQYTLRDSQIPDWCRQHPETYEGLLKHMTLDEVISSIPRMAALGMLDPSSDFSQKVIDRLSTVDELETKQLTPVAVFSKLKKYEGNPQTKWVRNQDLVKKLSDTYENLIMTRPSSNKRYLLAVHVNTKVTRLKVIGSTYLSPIAVCSFLVQQFLQMAESAEVVFFNQSVTELAAVKRGLNTVEILEHILKAARDPGNEVTVDLTQPFTWASNNRKLFDRIVVVTDKKAVAPGNEAQVLHDAIAQYRTSCQPDAKVAVLGVSDTTSFPNLDDLNYLEVCGFDKSVPPLVDLFFEGNSNLGENGQ